ncbi:uncharacterized protein ALTATR162_LOCUS9364 [Alternaria atra]|uniref:Uncharacterized protein n=1 Tax=Alternaria atra TaxID=119953 RepID=A0A8J2N8V9_9PLEO|nr:uncharacterized protein ALTATR162_LOCUS9364 [Alternaria atra]CAG5179594.1 unnamed protein product [Alternaria atra]
MIKTLSSPIKLAFESGDKATCAVYTVTDKKPLGQQTYKLTPTNVPDGVDTPVNAQNPPLASSTSAARGALPTESSARKSR